MVSKKIDEAQNFHHQISISKWHCWCINENVSQTQIQIFKNPTTSKDSKKISFNFKTASHLFAPLRITTWANRETTVTREPQEISRFSTRSQALTIHLEFSAGFSYFLDSEDLQNAACSAENTPSMTKIQIDWHRLDQLNERIFGDCSNTTLHLLQRSFCPRHEMTVLLLLSTANDWEQYLSWRMSTSKSTSSSSRPNMQCPFEFVCTCDRMSAISWRSWKITFALFSI